MAKGHLFCMTWKPTEVKESPSLPVGFAHQAAACFLTNQKGCWELGADSCYQICICLAQPSSLVCEVILR